MTPFSVDSRWPKFALIGTVVVLIAVVWTYLAGGIFLLANHRRFDEATPLTLYQYWYYYRHTPQVAKWLYIAMGIAGACVVAPFLMFFAPAKRSLFGDAKFASSSQVGKAGLRGEKGIIVGKFKGKYLVFGGSQHVIMSAPTRSGKGVGVVIPNLLSWPDSVVVLDVKQENHGRTSKYRERHGQPCYLFNPGATDGRTHRYNPLSYISEDPSQRIDDIQKIANMVFPDVQGTDVIWTATPRSLFLGLVLYLLETPGKLVTFGQVLRETLIDGDGAKYFAAVIQMRALGESIVRATKEEAAKQAREDVAAVLADKAKAADSHPRMGVMAVWAHLSAPYRAEVGRLVEMALEANTRTPDLVAMLDATPFDRGSAMLARALSGTCVRALNSYISITSDNTRTGVIGSFRSRLELWFNPLIDAATSGNDFDLRDVRKRRMSIYLGVTPDNLDRMATLLNLFFQQLIDLNTRELPERNPALKFQCLLLADEFTAPGKMGILSKGIGYIAGYGLRMLPIIQSPSQLVEVYGKDAAATFTTNHALQIVFPPKASELQNARDISEWLGYQTVDGTSESKPKNPFAKRDKTLSVSDQRRALLLPQEITSLGRDKELVVVEDCPPILASKIRYYADPVFVNRLKEVSPSLRALGRKLPTQRQLDDAAARGEMGAGVPIIDLDAHHALVAEHPTVPAPIARAGGASTVVVTRQVTADDMPDLSKLALAHFNIDFSEVRPPPPADRVDEQALRDYANGICDAVLATTRVEEPEREMA